MFCRKVGCRKTSFSYISQKPKNIMKSKYKATLLVGMTVATVSIFTFSCSKEKIKQQTATTMPVNSVKSKGGTNSSNAKSVSASIYADHVTSVSNVLASEQIMIKFKQSEQWRDLPATLKADADFMNARVATYDYSDNMKVMEIPSKTITGKSLIVYSYISSDGNTFKFLPAIAEFLDLQNGMKQFALKSIEGHLYYGLKVAANNTVGEHQIGIQLPIGDIVINPNPGGSSTTNDTPTCPESTNNFNDCMNCAFGECNADWLCTLACGVGPNLVFCATGFALACAFA